MSFERAAIDEFQRTLRLCDESCAAAEASLHLDTCLDKIDRLTAEKEQAEAQVRRIGATLFALVEELKVRGNVFSMWPDELKTLFNDALVDQSPLSAADRRWVQELFGLTETEGR